MSSNLEGRKIALSRYGVWYRLLRSSTILAGTPLSYGSGYVTLFPVEFPTQSAQFEVTPTEVRNGCML